MQASRKLPSHLHGQWGVGMGTRCSFWRGGTSKGILIQGQHLPAWTQLSSSQRTDLNLCERALQPFFCAAFGSPDPYGRQLNGLGGGISSLSKAIIVEPSTHKDVDVDYWFIQIGIRDGKLDMAGNCGNMSSAVAPFAWNQACGVDSGGLLQTQGMIVPGTKRAFQSRVGRFETQKLSMRLRNMNTSKIIESEIQLGLNNSLLSFEERGDYRLDGVSGKASPITLSFLDPGGSKTGKALPTGKPIDTLDVDGTAINATLTDISNPGVFIDGRHVQWDPTLQPEQLTANTELMTRLESIRRAGAIAMGLNPDVPSIPKIVLVYPPHDDQIDIRCQALSMEQAHKAVPVTLSLNLGVASKLDGTIPNQLARQRDPQNTVVGHPSGRIEVGAEIVDGHIRSARLVRTARWLMDGVVNHTETNDWVEI